MGRLEYQFQRALSGLFIPRMESFGLDSNNTTFVHTGTTSRTTMKTFVLPGGIMGPNGVLFILSYTTVNSNANNKQFIISFGGTDLVDHTMNSTNQCVRFTVIRNRNSVSSQCVWNIGSSIGLGTSGNAIGTASVDTSQNVTINIDSVLATSTDTMNQHACVLAVARPY